MEQKLNSRSCNKCNKCKKKESEKKQEKEQNPYLEPFFLKSYGPLKHFSFPRHLSKFD